LRGTKQSQLAGIEQQGGDCRVRLLRASQRRDGVLRVLRAAQHNGQFSGIFLN